MSNSSPLKNERPRQSNSAVDEFSNSLGARILTRPVQFTAFWAAIALPFFYIPLIAGETVFGAGMELLPVLFVANIVALVVGHGHKQ
ncbi:hypothetical protein AUR64_17145 [Haloprofundus marisrubri]|uniref:Uncharacterized protein n=1 Tax=Haloprofundus marisrubri TaxID=1514971 RepID=A0A0W1R857_9EURY|nr:hypothetical protein [Haloprofundus marisrubri]KTG09497.1 hypothetical protein AUR64_17145 [Haloprofundus marisrubri]